MHPSIQQGNGAVVWPAMQLRHLAHFALVISFLKTRRSHMTVNNASDLEVLIVGAGPVGLFLANECARRNLRWRLIEERSSQSEHSKALAIFPRTLEIFDMAGIV